MLKERLKARQGHDVPKSNGERGHWVAPVVADTVMGLVLSTWP